MFGATFTVALLLVTSVAAAGPFIYPPDAAVGVVENKPVNVRWTPNTTTTHVRLILFQKRGDDGGYAMRTVIDAAEDPGIYNWTPIPLDNLPFGLEYRLHFNLRYGEDEETRFNSGAVFIKNPEKVATPSPSASSTSSTSSTQSASPDSTTPAQESTKAASTKAASTSTPQAEDPGSNDQTTKVGLGVGLGLGIPFLLVVGAVVWFYFRHRRRQMMNTPKQDFETPSSQYGWSVSSHYPKAELADTQTFSPGGSVPVGKSETPPAPKELPAEIP